MAVTAMKAKGVVESLRDVAQDLLVPELKAIKADVASLRTEMQLRDANQTAATRNLAEIMDRQFQNVDKQFQNVDKRFQDVDKQFDRLSAKLDLLLDVRERLARLEGSAAKS